MTVEQKKERAARKTRIGVVVSNKMDKTIVVRVDRRVPHPEFKKIVTLSKRYYAHNEKADVGLGDRVKIVETRPLSKLKRWRVQSVVEKAAG